MAKSPLNLTRIPVGHAMNKVIEAAGKPRIPSKEELRARRLRIKETRLRKEEEELRSVRFLIEKVAEDGISSVKELALHAGCKPGVVEKLFRTHPELQDQIRMMAEKPRLYAKRAIAKQMKKASECNVFDKDIAKAATDYLKVRGDEDFRGDSGGGGYGGVQINIVGVSPKGVAVRPTRITPAREAIDDE